MFRWKCWIGLAPTRSHVSLEMLDWIGSDPFFCLVGGMKYGMDDSFNSVNGSHMS
jgi:hypothetical protein